MFYPLHLAVLKSEGGGLAEGNMQVGGEPSQKQVILLFDTESWVCKLLSLTNKRSFVEGKRNISLMSSCKQLIQHVVVHYRDEHCAYAGRLAMSV